MYTKLSSRIEEITPKRAEQLLKLNVFDGQRPSRRHWVSYLCNEMKTGHFRRGDISIARNGDGKEYLLNGQHQLLGVIESGCTISVALDRYDCESSDDFYKLYSTFDGHLTRSIRDLLRAAKGNFRNKSLNSTSMEVLRVCVSALPCIENKVEFPAHNIKKPERLALIEDHHEEIAWVGTLLNEDSKNLFKCVTVAAAIKCFRVSPQKATEFWIKVLSAANLSPGTPQYALNRILTRGIRTTRQHNSRLGPRLTYGYCIAYWNAWITGSQKPRIAGAALLTETEPSNEIGN